MKKIFTFFLLGINLLTYSQIPYIRLKAYYPFVNSSQDEIGAFGGLLSGAEFVQNRFELDSNALSFDGLNDFVAIPTDFDFPSRTISLWFKANEITNYHGLYNSDHPELKYGSTNIDLHQDGFGNNLLRLECGGGQGKDLNDTIELDQWYHAVITIDTISVLAYVNGEQIDSTDFVDHRSIDGDSTTYLGCGRNESSYNFNGIIDDVRIYDTVLSKKDIMFLYYESPCIQQYMIYDTLRVYDTTTIIDSILVVDSIAVTDTLIIDFTITSTHPSYQGKIKVYPNPTNKKLYIEIEDYEIISDVTIRIVDLQSRIIVSEEINSDLKILDLSQFGQKGMYILEIVDRNSNILDAKKILLE